RYALRIVFDDGHDSGIYTWDWLYRLGRDQDRLLAEYRRAVQA
ncbi:MAG: gamma-butyrobetaine hydroxylase-like domain-containing protein, partial [bacterium]